MEQVTLLATALTQDRQRKGNEAKVRIPDNQNQKACFTGEPWKCAYCKQENHRKRIAPRLNKGTGGNGSKISLLLKYPCLLRLTKSDKAHTLLQSTGSINLSHKDPWAQMKVRKRDD